MSGKAATAGTAATAAAAAGAPIDPAVGIFGIGFTAMACPCEIRLAAPSEAEARRLARPAIDEVLRIEAKYSRYRPDSVVGRINAAAGGDPVRIDDETAGLLAYAAALYASSDGLFDISSGILRRAWDFRAARLPAQAQLDALLPLIGWPRVERTSNSIRLPEPGMEIDFGGFGKEYAADRAAALLRDAGVAVGYVNLGGDMHIIGAPPERPWQIGIQDPRDEDATIASLPLHSGGLATSGDYERYFELDGRRYCHILSPLTGMPVTGWRSISVLAPLCAAAGSLSTIAMLKGEGALEFLDAAGVAWLAVDADGRRSSKSLGG